MGRTAVSPKGCGVRHSEAPARKARRHDAGPAGVWRRAAPMTRPGRLPRRPGARPAILGALELATGQRRGAQLSPYRPAKGRDARSACRHPLEGGGPLCGPGVGVDGTRPRHVLYRAVGVDRCRGLPGGGGGSLARAGISSADRHEEAQARRAAASPGGAAAAASGCVCRSVAAALIGYGDRIWGRIGKALRLSNTAPEILILIIAESRGELRACCETGLGRRYSYGDHAEVMMFPAKQQLCVHSGAKKW